MSTVPAASLSFYTALRQHDLSTAGAKSALAFARVCHDLLTRIAAAWATQRGLETVPRASVPNMRRLFDLAVAGENALDRSAVGLPGLLAEVVLWLRSGFDAGDPFSTSYQVWVGQPGDSQIRLCGPQRPAPPPSSVLVSSDNGLQLASELAQASIVAIGHYDVHGLAMLALSLRSLREAGVAEASGVMGFEETGDIGKLWKRTIPRALKRDQEGAAVLLIDCPVHSRTPEHTLKAVRLLESLPAGRLILIDHHPDTVEMSPLLARTGAQLVLTDVLSCGLLGSDDTKARQLRILGALGDKVPEVAASHPESSHADLYAANKAFQESLLHFSPTPKAFKASGRLPAEALWEALASGAQITSDQVNLVIPDGLAIQGPEGSPTTALCGSVLCVTSRLTTLGRSWYGLLEDLMETANVSYAFALRVLDGNRANMLLLTHWKHTYMPPVRSFIPEPYWPRCLGHPAAVWVDLDKRNALEFLAAVVANANDFLATPAAFGPIAIKLQQNILEQPPSGHSSPENADIPEE